MPRRWNVSRPIHRDNGLPVAAVPLSWSHAMIAIAVAATTGKHVWRLADDFDMSRRSRGVGRIANER
jgi:hypothetical protein